MILKKLSITLAAAVLVNVFFISNAMANDPKWREKQKAMFEEIDLFPGDVITKDNWQKAEGFVPDTMLSWFKRGWWEARVGEMNYDLSPDAEWMEYGPKNNVGKYKIDDYNIVDAKTGKGPLNVYGEPFPNVDETIADDPMGPTKLMYNRFCDYNRTKNKWLRFSLEWVGLERGFERAVIASRRAIYWWGINKTDPIPNPTRHRTREIMYVTEPFDLRGTTQLTNQRLDGKPDEVYVYVPAIRRVKKMSGTNRSDPYMGSDFVIEDGSGYNGQPSVMKWRFIKETTGLHLISEWNSKRTDKFVQLPNGSWESPVDNPRMKKGWEVKGHTRNVIEPMNAVWVPRKFYIIEAIPKDPYYNYGRMVYWVDKNMRWMLYKVIYDRALEYWKTVINTPVCSEWANGKKGTQYYDEMLGIDEKTHHACTVTFTGTSHGHRTYCTFDDPNVNVKIFSPERLPTMTK